MNYEESEMTNIKSIADLLPHITAEKIDTTRSHQKDKLCEDMNIFSFLGNYRFPSSGGFFSEKPDNRESTQDLLSTQSGEGTSQHSDSQNIFNISCSATNSTANNTISVISSTKPICIESIGKPDTPGKPDVQRLETQKETSRQVTTSQNKLDDKKTFQIGSYRAWSAPIGHGSFSEVFKAYHVDTKTVVAIKSLRINAKTNINRIYFEINIMKDLHHPNIIRLIDVIDMVDEGRLYLVLEYCSGGTLDKYIEGCETLAESKVHHYLKDMSEGLKYLRKKNILHRDLKPHNLLISEDNTLKISDFGLSTILENDKMTETFCGSPLYMAPEVLMSNIYGVKSDLWSIGIIMYQLVYGKHPYVFKNVYDLVRSMNESKIEFPHGQISQNCVSLLKGLLVTDNNKRICWGEFFAHPWLNNTEFIEDTYKVSQPIGIPSRTSKILKSEPDKRGFLYDCTIDNYNPSIYQYDPICHSEPTRKLEISDTNKIFENGDKIESHKSQYGAGSVTSFENKSVPKTNRLIASCKNNKTQFLVSGEVKVDEKQPEVSGVSSNNIPNKVSDTTKEKADLKDKKSKSMGSVLYGYLGAPFKRIF